MSRDEAQAREEFADRYARAWVSTSEPLRDEVAAVDGADAVDERLHGWRDVIATVERESLRRTLYWGRRSSRG